MRYALLVHLYCKNKQAIGLPADTLSNQRANHMTVLTVVRPSVVQEVRALSSPDVASFPDLPPSLNSLEGLLIATLFLQALVDLIQSIRK